MPERVRVEVEDRIARVVLNRPAKHNAIDRPMFEALIEAGERLASNRSLRAVVLAGAGENFCSGIDISIFAGADAPVFDPRDLKPRQGSDANLFQSAALVWRRLPVPVIAAVRGAAFGAGLQVAMGADLRLATGDSRWSVMEVKWGIVPDMGLTVTAGALVRPDRLKRLAFTGAIIDGREALEAGFVTGIHDDPLEAALSLARELAGRSPDAVRAVKALVDEAPGNTEADNLRHEAALQATLLGGANQVEAVTANLQGREPLFRDPRD